MAKWFVVDKGVKAGPFSDSAFFDYLKNKDPAAVQIWREGMSAWVPAANLPQLVAVMAPARTARPPRRSKSAAWLCDRPRSLCASSCWAASAPCWSFRMSWRAIAWRRQRPLRQTRRPRRRAAPQPPRNPRRRLNRRRRQAASAARISPMPCASPCPLLDRLQQHFPKQYDDLVGEFYERLSNGYPGGGNGDRHAPQSVRDDQGAVAAGGRRRCCSN